jgi:hypothetical protein
MTQIRLEVQDYTLRVLDVIKGKFGLKNRDSALDKFMELYGEEYLEPQVNENVLKEMDEIYESHMKRKDRKNMTLKELDSLLGLK